MDIFVRVLKSVNYASVGSVFVAMIDILVVAFILYRLIMLAKGTRAQQIALGIAVYFGALWLSNTFSLHLLNWLLKIGLTFGPVAIVILFYPELRQALEEFGGLWPSKLRLPVSPDPSGDAVEEIVRAAAGLAAQNIGALIVIEHTTGLDNIIATGAKVDSSVTAPMLRTIFYPGSPMHDGAAIIRGERIVAAGCQLPLSDNMAPGATLGMRHRAALGASEQGDAAVIVVSEELGAISLCHKGKLTSGYKPDRLLERLKEIFEVKDQEANRTTFRQTLGRVASRASRKAREVD
ncbi:MAG: TIGR00159 family protein [Armatimonadetes bacterium]|nr:TIGR00159 family protein [Armatimonadota bacterium]